MSVFYKQAGLDADARVLVTKLPMPKNGGHIVTAPDALGRARRCIFADFGGGIGERAVDLDRDGPGFNWSTVEDFCRKTKTQTLPVNYDGPADMVPEGLLIAADGQVILYRKWRTGPWKPYEPSTEVSFIEPVEKEDDAV